MTQKTTKRKRGVVSPGNEGERQHEEAEKIAQLQLRPTIQGALTAARIVDKKSDPALTLKLAEELSTQVGAVLNGDLSRAEAMLITQAHTLDSMFNSLVRAAKSIEGTPNFDQYLRVALKAQAQARATLEALSRIKNPTVAFVKQANVAQGAQQVNNYADSGDASRARPESEYPQSKVLEEDDGE